MKIRAGDTVLHRPTGENWRVALDEGERGEIYWLGYPFGGHGEAKDCTRIRKADDDERRDQLEEVSRSTKKEMADRARRQLGIPLICYSLTTYGQTYDPKSVPTDALIYSVGGKNVVGFCESCRQPIVEGDEFHVIEIDVIECCRCHQSSAEPLQ